MKKKSVDRSIIKSSHFAIIVVTLIIALTIYYICNTIQWYYYGNLNIMYSKYPTPYLLDKLIKNGEVKISGECNIDNANIPLKILYNTTSNELSKFELNGIAIGQLKCQYEIIAGKK